MMTAALRGHGLIDQTFRDEEGAECDPTLPDGGGHESNIKYSTMAFFMGEKCDVVHHGFDMNRKRRGEADDGDFPTSGFLASFPFSGGLEEEINPSGCKRAHHFNVTPT